MTIPSSANPLAGPDAPSGALPAAAAMAGAALLAFSPLLVRWSELGPQATSFWRFALALPILLPFVLCEPRKPSARQTGALLAAGVFFGGDIALWSAALFFTTVANATLLSNMTPIYAALAGWFLFKERPRAGVWAGGAAALAGALTLAIARAQFADGPGQGPSATPEHGWIGDLMGFASAFWYAGYLIIVRALGNRVGVASVLFYAGIGSAVLCLATSALMHETLWPQSARGWAVLVALGIVVQIGGQGLIAWGVARLPITTSTMLLWVQPVSAAALSWILFGEALGPLALAGAALVLGGIYIVQRARAPA